MTANEWLIIVCFIMIFICGYNIGKVAGMREVIKYAVHLGSMKKEGEKRC